jgi:general secretion pathway protein G
MYFRNRQRRTEAHQRGQAGQTLLELIMACAILMILATSALPVARYTVKRRQEAELRADLREMRDAIDRYKDAADRNLIRVEAGTEGYPPDLNTLVNGVDMAGQSAGNTTNAIPGQSTTFSTSLGANTGTSSAGSSNSATRHVRFLRKIPVDPMTGRPEWGMRSVQDDPDSTSWGGKDVFDVFSRSTGTALDGTHYSDW